MRPEFRDQVLAALDEVAQIVGIPAIEQGIDLSCRAFEKLLGMMNPIRTREAFSESLDQAEVPPEEEPIVLASLRVLPHFIGTEIKQAAKQAAKDFPTHTGRKGSLSAEQKAEMCAFIGKLYAQGVKLTVCKQRAAQRFGVGVRTVERAWRHRGDLPAQPDFETAMAYLLKVLSGSAQPS